MSLQRLIINTDLSAAGFISVCDLAPGQLPALNNFINYCGALAGGNQMALLSFSVGMTQATGTFTFSSAVNTNTLVINGVTFTCVTSGATGNQFNVGASDTLTAANAVIAINASSSALASGSVVASSSGTTLTLTAIYPGTTGNTITTTATGGISAGAARLTGGSNGTAYTLDMR